MMHAQSLWQQEKQVAALTSLALLIFTYLAFSVRSVTDPLEPGDFVNLKRLLAVGAGTLMFWMVIGQARGRSYDQWHERPIGIAVMSAAALGLVLATRIGYDLLFPTEAKVGLVRNLRWAIIWLGYFGAAVLGYFAVIFGLALQRAKAHVHGSRQDRLAAVLTEVGSWSRADRRALVAMLDGPTEYECADPLFTAYRAGTGQNEG